MIHVADISGESANGINSALSLVLPLMPSTGCEIEVWTPRRGSKRVSISYFDRISVVEIPLGSRNRLRYGRFRKEVRRTLQERCEGADFLHLHSVYSQLNTRIASLCRLPVIWTPHGGLSELAERHHGLRKRVHWLLFDRRMLKRVVGVIAVSVGEATYLRKRFRQLPVEVIENPIPFAASGLPPARKSNDISRPNFNYLLFLGRLDIRQKGLDILLESYARAVEIHEVQHKLVLAGPSDKDSRARLQRRAKDLGISESVIFTGAQFGAAKIELMTQAHALLVPSRWEGLPVVALEALSLGVPIIASRMANLGEYFERANTAVRCDLKSHDFVREIVEVTSLSSEQLMSRRMESLRIASLFPSADRASGRLASVYVALRDSSAGEPSWEG